MSTDPYTADRGRCIAGRYELVEVAGEGGMATVWRALIRGAAGFERSVAVKKMKPEFRAAKNYIAMFVEEARVGSDLQHPNIVQVYDFCQDEDKTFYLVMEWVDGIDMGNWLRAFRAGAQPTPWPLVCAIGVGALRGLAAAHERPGAPVVHRDVSPHNILLGLNGVAKLTDFGLARALDRIHSLTAPGTVKGKLSYLAPELTMGKTAAIESDLFAMGSVLWEALAGEQLFDGSSDLDVFGKIRRGEVRPLDSKRPDVPAAVIELVHRALAVDPRARFPSAREMANSLAEVIATVQSATDAQTLVGRAVRQARDWLGLHRQLGASALEARTVSMSVIEVGDEDLEPAEHEPTPIESANGTGPGRR